MGGDIQALLEEQRKTNQLLGQLLSYLSDGQNQPVSIATDEQDLTKSKQADTLPLSEAWKVLGYRNYHQCWRKIKGGLYRVGREVEDRSSSEDSDPQYWLRIEACRKRNLELPAKRTHKPKRA